MAKPLKDHAVSIKTRIAYVAGFLLLTGISFCLGIWIMFPDTALERRINTELARRIPFAVKVENIERRLPATLYSRKVYAELAPLPLTIADFKLRPLWSSLLHMDPAAVATGNMFGGSVACTCADSGAATLHARQMLISFPLPELSSVQVELNLERADLEAMLDKQMSLNKAQVHLNAVNISGLQQLGLDSDSINLGSFNAMAVEKNRRLEVKLDNPQGNFGLSAQGFLAPTQISPSTRISLELRIANIPEHLRQLEDLLSIAGIRKNADGYRIRLGGNLGQPHLR